MLHPSIVFQQEKAVPYWSFCVRQFSNDTFPNRWIKKDEAKSRPPPSPNFTSRFVSLWLCKDCNKMYRKPVDNLHSLTSRIAEAIESVTLGMLQNTWPEIKYRVDIFRAIKEQYGD